MKNKNFTKKFVLIFIFLFIFLLILLILLLFVLQNNDESGLKNGLLLFSNQNRFQTVQDAIEKSGSTYLKEESNRIYVIFGKDLYDKNGNSNERYFEDLKNDVIPFFKNGTFHLIDENKVIDIFVSYNLATNNYDMKINDIEDFFNNKDGEINYKLQNVEIAPKTFMYRAENYYLSQMRIHNDYFSALKDSLGEGKELTDGYTSYLDDTIRIRTVPTGVIKNIIFTNKFEGELTSEIDTNNTLEEIAEKKPSYCFGGLSEDYLGYIDDYYYYFFYDDEASIYTYSYKENSAFEELLKDYLESKDLDKFASYLKIRWLPYDKFEYDKENNSLYALYSTRGVEINIKNNDSTGIVFYQNYYYTDYVKSLIMDHTVGFDANTDLVQKIELERREKNK